MSPLLFETLTLEIAHSVDAAKMYCLSSHQNTPLIKKSSWNNKKFTDQFKMHHWFHSFSEAKCFLCLTFDKQMPLGNRCSLHMFKDRTLINMSDKQTSMRNVELFWRCSKLAKMHV